MLADLIHHCRAELTLPQLSRIIHIYSANIHDPTIAAAIQTMCSKLLLNLIDPIAAKESVDAVKVLQRIMVGFVSKMEAMAEVRDEWPKWGKVRQPLPVVLAKMKADEVARDAKAAAKAAAAVDEDVEMKISEIEDEEIKMKVSGDSVPKEVTVVEEDEYPMIELDDVDIERAKPIKREVLMVDPGIDPVKGRLIISNEDLLPLLMDYRFRCTIPLPQPSLRIQDYSSLSRSTSRWWTRR